MNSMNGTAPAPMRLVVDDAGRRVLVIDGEGIVLPGAHPAGEPIPEPRLMSDESGRRWVLLGSERVALPRLEPAPGAAAPAVMVGEPARIVTGEDGKRVVVVGGERLALPPVAFAPEEAAAARVATDDSGRRILFVGSQRVILHSAAGAAAARGTGTHGPAAPAPAPVPAPMRVVVDESGRRILVVDGERIVLPGAHPGGPIPEPRLMMDEAGRRFAVLGDERIPLPSAAPAPAAAAPGAGEPARIATDDAGRLVVVVGAERIPLPPIELKPGDAESVRVVTDDHGRRILFVGAERIILRAASAPAPASSPASPAPSPVGTMGMGETGTTAASPSPSPHAVSSYVPAREPAFAPLPFDLGDEGEEPELNLRSDEMEDIIGYVPHWVVRWGISLIFATVGALLLTSWFVRYPDMVEGKVTLTTPEPPSRLAARTAGEVEKLFVADGQPVERGAPLVVIRGPADYRDVFALNERLDRFERSLASPSVAAAVPFDANLSLGDIQAPYAAFLQALSDFRSFSGAGYYAGKGAELERQLAEQERLRETLVAKQALAAEALAISGRNRDRARTLAQRGLISQEEMERAEADYIQHRSAEQDGRNAMASGEIQISSLRSQLLDLRKTGDDQGRNSLLSLRTAFGALRAAVAHWDQEHVLRAPVAGRVSLFRGLAEHQAVDANDPVIAVVPASGRVVGRVLLSESGAGKVEPGQTVLIRFDSYPSREFGSVEGRVTSIAQVPFQQRDKDESMYLVDVAVPSKLVTNYHREIPFRQEMRGQAQIVTRDLRLLERVFNQLRDLLDHAGGH
ncbi:HlyD family secretion protein [Longimicrobium sp.]|uniref:HlyD family secretion protein n=1 Tax=Longimicrobium sp. TaxID=2029185 RepID=UPI002C0A99C5|nr:HlyD family efflux transporter periplasmic adaptor subunit [Longimicrobium sp.]HSU12858.1 HlyD family efflux transporter periplasmic adaptor subunit [Longimicrobium sp.]